MKNIFYLDAPESRLSDLDLEIARLTPSQLHRKAMSESLKAAKADTERKKAKAN